MLKILVATVLAGALFGITACGNKEPKTVNHYYNCAPGTTNCSGGTSTSVTN